MGKQDILDWKADVLDHGFVRVVDAMGDDAAVVQAARTSYGTGTKEVNEDRGLIRYLMRHWHTTPFEMAEIKLHVKLPIFVARQWIRHRTANVNEYSARYSILDREFYIPELEHIGMQSTTNAQGQGELAEQEAREDFQSMLKHTSNQAYDKYEHYAGDVEDGGKGIARELARMNLPPNIYTQWYWKVDVHNLMHFLRLRADPHAQREIRVYADAMLEMLRMWMPQTHEAFWDYRMEAVTLSAHEYEIIRQLTTGECRVDEDALWGKLSKRETAEFKAKFFPDK